MYITLSANTIINNDAPTTNPHALNSPSYNLVPSVEVLETVLKIIKSSKLRNASNYRQTKKLEGNIYTKYVLNHALVLLYPKSWADFKKRSIKFITSRKH